jgi:GNAT superfamily N-acetyltransferase
VQTSTDGQAVAVWVPSERLKATPTLREALAVPGLLRAVGPWRSQRLARFGLALHFKHPCEAPHDYLMLLGVRPEARRRGAGSALLASHLQRLDRVGRGAFLETPIPRTSRSTSTMVSRVSKSSGRSEAVRRSGRCGVRRGHGRRSLGAARSPSGPARPPRPVNEPRAAAPGADTAMFDKLVDFLALYPPLSHIVIGVAMQSVIGLALGLARVRRAWWFGAAFAIGFYFSRKKLEVELHADPSGLHKASTWDLGWIPFFWPRAYQLQFYAPTAAVLIVAVLVERARRSDGGA